MMTCSWAAVSLAMAVAGGPAAISAFLTINGAALIALAFQRGGKAQAVFPVSDAYGHLSIPQPEAAAIDGDPPLATLGHRLLASHPVSGLPMREALLARMSADRTGMLGAIAFMDFDRLTAFDPALGERVFAASIARLRAMLPPDRAMAQVDRGKVGLWFPGETTDEARAELDAIGYALSEAIDDGGTSIVPEIKLRLSHYDAADGLEPGSFVARTLASFTLPDGEVAAPSSLAHGAGVARERYKLEQDLRQAITRRELRLAFQPLVDAGQGCVCGAEALIRWDHRELGAVPPSRFVPIMESMGLANEIGLWVLNAAIREAQDWRSRGLSNLRVAVNVSGLQLERDDLALLVQRTLQRHELPATALEIELTESIATSNAQHCRRIFQDLRALGVKLAVDDFGTGYSGFSSLRTLAFDKIKIDREFVTEVDTRRDSQAICQSIFALGRGLGIRVLAEGVERREEYEWLRRHGCRHFQGYYFAPPLTGEAFVAFACDTAALAARLASEPRDERINERRRA